MTADITTTAPETDDAAQLAAEAAAAEQAAEGTQETAQVPEGDSTKAGRKSGNPKQDRANGDAKGKVLSATAARKAAATAIGDAPGNKAGRDKLAAMTKTAAASVRKAAIDAYLAKAPEGLTVAKAWAEAIAAAPAPQPKPAAAPRTPAAPKVTPEELAAKVPAGYELKWPHGGHSLLAKTGDHEGPAWKVLCNAHGTLHDAASAKEAESLGAKAVRATWCKTELLEAKRAETAAAR